MGLAAEQLKSSQKRASSAANSSAAIGKKRSEERPEAGNGIVLSNGRVLPLPQLP